MRRLIFSLLFMGSLFFCSFAIVAQSNSGDETQIRAIVQSETDAWNVGDAEAFGAHYAENGSFVNIVGQQLYGRKAFVAQHAAIFSTIYKGSHSSFVITKLTFLRPDVALVEIDGAVTGASRLPPGVKASDNGALNVKLLEVMTKEKGNWSIAAFHNVAVYPLPAGPPAK